MNATIKDIARKARVSYATVSRALNNEYGVRSETRTRIVEIAKELNYRPNRVARGLVKRETNTIGLVIPDITNPFYPEVARGVEEGAKERGYSVFLCNTNWQREREHQYINLLVEKRVDGLILAPGSNVSDTVQDRLIDQVRVVYVSEVPRDTGRSYVVIDNVRGGFLATKHLIEAGYKKIGFIGAVEEAFSIDERLEGYRLAFERYGIPIEERYIKLGHFNQETGALLIRQMIEAGDYPRAVFAENDLLALGVIQGVRSKGLTVPGDVAVVGFDDIPFASFQEVQLTTVYQPKYDMGRIAAEILLDEINGGTGDNAAAADSPANTNGDSVAGVGTVGGTVGGTSRRVILEPQLIVRKTSIVTK